MGNNVTFDEMNELLDEIYHSGGETWVEIDGQTYYTDWGYGVVAIEFFIRMLKNRKSDNDATQARQDVVADVDEIIEHVINANMLSMPYDVYSELFDAVDGLGVEIENLQAENDKLREDLEFANNEWEKESMEYLSTQAENAKLRELSEKAWKAAEMLCQAWDGSCHADGVSIKPPCPLDERDELCVYGLIQRDLRELGVEVD